MITSRQEAGIAAALTNVAEAFINRCYNLLCQLMSFILSGCRLRNHESGQQESHSSDALKPRKYEDLEPLPSLRERRLSLPLPAISKASQWSLRPKQRTSRQSQASLFEKLPGEVRMMIYHELLCGPVPVIHIVLRKHAPGDIRCGYIGCRAAAGKCYQQRCLSQYNDMTGGDWCARNVSRRTDGDVLPLLMSCRQIYSEAIDMVYKDNAFSFYDLRSIHMFACITLPQRLNTIRMIHLETNVYFELRYQYAYRFSQALLKGEIKFDRAYQAISSMQGLRQIWIKVTRDELSSMSVSASNEWRRRDDGMLREILAFADVEVIIEKVS